MRTFTAGVAISDPKLRDDIRCVLLSAGARVAFDQPGVADVAAIRRADADALLIEAAPPRETVGEIIRRVKAVIPDIFVAAVHREPDPEVILNAMRSGIDEFVLPPFDQTLPAALERLVGRRLSRERSSREPGRVTAFVSAKGGCGATTVAWHFAGNLQRTTSHDILLADLDLDSGLIGFLAKTKTAYSILDAFRNIHRLDISFWKALVEARHPRLDILPAGEPLAFAERPGGEDFASILELVRSMYNWVVLDLGRGLSRHWYDVADRIDEIYLVSTPEVSALYQARVMAQKLAEAKFPPDRLRLILNRVARRHTWTTDDIRKSVGMDVAAELPESAETDDAWLEGRLVDARSGLGRELGGFVGRITGTEEQPAKPRFAFLTGARKAAAES